MRSQSRSHSARPAGRPWHAVPVGTPTDPWVLAETGRFVVAQAGPRVLLLDRGPAPSEVTVLLLVMSALIFGGFGVVSVFSAVAGAGAARTVVIGVVFLAVGVASFAAMLRAARALHRARTTPLRALRPVAVFDRERRLYLDGHGEVIAPLAQVQVRRAGFGAATLVAVTPAGERVLVRGNPVSGGVGNLDQLLTHAITGDLG